MEPEVQEPKIVFKGDVGDSYGSEIDYNKADPAEVEKPAEVTAEEKPAEQPPAETVVEGEKPAEAPAETPVVETAQAAPVIQQAAPQSEPITPADPYDLLGIKEEERTLAEGFIKALQAGDLENFLRVRGTDWNKVPDFELVRSTYAEKYKDLDPEERDFMVADQMAKYETDSFDEDGPDAKRAKILLKMEAKSIRDGKIAEQNQYKIPERAAEQPPAETAQQVLVQMRKEADEITKTILADPALTEFETNKVVKLGSGPEPFNYISNVDVRAILKDGTLNDYLIDQPNGAPPKWDMPKLIRSVATRNIDDIADKLIEHGKMLGKRELDIEARNPGKRPTAAPEKTDGIRWLGDR